MSTCSRQNFINTILFCLSSERGEKDSSAILNSCVDRIYDNISFCQCVSPSNQLLYVDYPLAGKCFPPPSHKSGVINLRASTLSFTTWRLETVGDSFPSFYVTE